MSTYTKLTSGYQLVFQAPSSSG